MTIPQIVVVENEFLSLIPGEGAAPEHVAVPFVRLRDIPSSLGRCSGLHSFSNLLNQTRNEGNEKLPMIEMKEGTLQEERQSLQTGHGSFCIPGSAPVEIYDTGKKETYLVRHGETHVQISNTCGYWISDFCGVGGFQQVLWLPNISIDLKEWSVALAKRVLAQVLCQSVLMDGVGCYLSKDVRIGQCSTPFADACPDIILCRVSETAADNHDEPMQTSTSDNEDERRMKNTNSVRESYWRITMTSALEARLIQHRNEHDKRVSTQEAKRLLLKRNRKALQHLLNPEGTCLQVTRISHRTVSRGTGTVVVLAEVDVAAVEVISAVSGLHLSCSFMSTKGDDISIQTQSGVVPELLEGACVTIILMVQIDGIAFSNDCQELPPLRLNIEAHWTQDAEDKSHKMRRALNLTTFELPMELLLSIQSKMTAVEYSTDHVPSASYECRQPYKIEVDVSYCFPRDWNSWVDEFNDILTGSGHRIDLCDGDEDTPAAISFLLFAYPEKEIHGLITLMRNHLPDLAKLINS